MCIYIYIYIYTHKQLYIYIYILLLVLLFAKTLFGGMQRKAERRNYDHPNMSLKIALKKQTMSCTLC